MNILKPIKKIIRFLRKTKSIISKSYVPRYRVIHISKDKNQQYMATLQIIGKGYTFHQKPEDILADNNYVDFLSPRDVRMLTYLGYLEINQPEYKLLAKRLLEDNQEIFVIKKKGKKATFTQTTEEIHKNSEIIKKLNAEDAHTVGYALASKESLDELNAKKAAKNILGDKK